MTSPAPRTVALLAFAACVAACGGDGASSPAADGPPHLVFRANPVELGARFDDEKPETAIGLHNAGGRTLHVERVDANCGCIALGAAPATVEPGKDADLKFEIRLAGMTGKIQRHVVVKTDDPASPLARVTIEADVRPRIETTLPLVELRPDTLGAATSVDFSVHSATGEDLAGLSWSSTTSQVQVATAVSGKNALVHVSAAPFVDDFAGAVVLHLGAAERIVPVQGVSARDVRAVPPSVWAAGAVGAKIGETKLVARPGVAWSVRGLDSDRKELTAEVVGDALRVKIVAGAPAGEFKGAITVRFDGAKPETLRVPVTSWIEQQ